MITNKHLQPYNLEYYSENDLDNGNMTLIIDRLLEEVGSDDIFIDAGAYIGAMSVPVIAQKKPYLTVAIEPNTKAFPILQRNLKTFSGTAEYGLFNDVCADYVGEVLYQEADNTGSLTREYDEYYYPKKSRRAVTIDNLLKYLNLGHRKVVIKMDIEMSEPRAWKGMKNSFDDIKCVIMEFFFQGWRAQNMDALEFYDEIVSDGFSFYTLRNESIDRERFKQYVEGFNDDFILRR